MLNASTVFVNNSDKTISLFVVGGLAKFLLTSDCEEGHTVSDLTDNELIDVPANAACRLVQNGNSLIETYLDLDDLLNLKATDIFNLPPDEDTFYVIPNHTYVLSGVQFDLPCIIGDFVTFEGWTRIGERSVLGNSVTVGPQSTLGAHSRVGTGFESCRGLHVGEGVSFSLCASFGDHTTFADNVVIGACAKLGNYLKLGNNVGIGAHSSLGNNVVIGDNFIAGECVVFSHSTRIGADSWIGHSAYFNAISDSLEALPSCAISMGSGANVGTDYLTNGFVFYKTQSAWVRLIHEINK